MNEDYDYWTRAQLIEVQIAKVQLRAERATEASDLEELQACRFEMTVLYESMLDLRAEQLAASLQRNKPKRRWWQRRERSAG